MSIDVSLQVQRIKNEFTVTVYEIHARMALEVVRIIWHSQQVVVDKWWLGRHGGIQSVSGYAS